MYEETLTWFLLSVLAILVLSILGTAIGFLYMLFDDFRNERCHQNPQNTNIRTTFRLIKKD
jgi:hypothetical protein